MKLPPLTYRPVPSYHPSPLYFARLTAGFPSLALDYREKSLDLNEHLIPNPISTFFMRETNEALKESSILAGDLLIIDWSLKPHSGCIVIAGIAGELCIRRFKKVGKKITLKTDENDNKPFFLIPDDEI